MHCTIKLPYLVDFVSRRNLSVNDNILICFSRIWYGKHVIYVIYVYTRLYIQILWFLQTCKTIELCRYRNSTSTSLRDFKYFSLCFFGRWFSIHNMPLKVPTTCHELIQKYFLSHVKETFLLLEKYLVSTDLSSWF